MICPSCGKDTALPFNYKDVVGYDCSNCGIHAEKPKSNNDRLSPPYSDSE
jgi:hypothetical protein